MMESLTMLEPLLEGFKTTILFFILTLVGSIPLGLILALIEQKLPKWLGSIIRVYVYLFRGTPLLLQMMFVFFGLPFVGIVLGRFESALFTLIINYAAYFVEIFRGGLNAIPNAQYEALKVLSIDRFTGLRKVILPQLWKIVMPSVGNEVISLIKDTSLIYILGLDELLKTGRTLANQSASLLPFVYVGVIYLVFTGITTFILNKIEQKIED
ncbi:amino acid ABC transporter permease [Fundicoccus ignavus]|uniref:ABC transporter permease subunit n=1 Tax=Fundicoccus ignavus TaxID=2664442 RepID=A0A6I2GHX8_9LACT|nr:amino acid ABC transporter permease [Fundicoccus ignavus]MRI81468.1 ABC transporter permease subunit [Fundicoccus ignavus]MRI85452.1 ABC transporter permease subunit [Fundicoccus ignavus]MRJ47533.1 ABC transporter permease subunit [Fundicoccus ignavus]